LNPFIDAVGMAGHALITLGELIAQIVAKAAPVFGVSVDSGAAKRVRELEQQIYGAENSNDPISRMLLGVTKEQQETNLKQLRSALAMSKQKAGNENPTSVADSARQALDAGIAAAKNASATANARFNDPAEKKKRDDLRKQKEEDDKAARQLAVAKEKAAREAAAAAAKAAADAEKAAKARGDRQKEIDKKQEDVANASAFKADNIEALGGKSNEALKANDLRSSEGMSQFIALATGREDPAIAEYRKQSEKLQQIVAELRALQQQPVDMLGAAA
jgi:colicin import membrane protein